MATVTLSPWPTSPAALATARTCLTDTITEADGLPDARVDAIGGAASALVERYAPDAPAAVKNEAVIRTAAWLHARMPRTLHTATIGPMRMDVRERHYSPDALRNSGARALLSPWRLRRALPVGSAS
ncbi:MAG: hypothetical protein F4059_05645 [Gemmatimonadetes bacterium]|nr:hypothetical protein [Gemmatimonadota bacterium]